jgi:two-component system response regulator TctD
MTKKCSEEVDLSQSLVEKEVKSNTNYDVLIVESDEECSNLIQKVCKQLGHFRSIVTAKDGREARAKLSNQKFKLIFMDLNTPKINGLELIKVIENGENSLSRLVVTSHEIAQDQLTALVQKGVKQIMVKPFGSENLIAKIQAIFPKP